MTRDRKILEMAKTRGKRKAASIRTLHLNRRRTIRLLVGSRRRSMGVGFLIKERDDRETTSAGQLIVKADEEKRSA